MIGKKRTTVCIVTSLVFTMLLLGGGFLWSAGEKEKKAEERVTVKMSVFGMPWENKVYTDYAIPEFEKQNPNIKVDFVRYDDYWKKIPMLAAGGNLPDVIRYNDERYGQLRMKGALKPVTEYINDPKIGVDMSQYHEIAMENLEADGKIWGLPQDFSIKTCLLFNKDMFDKAGVEYPDESWDYDDLLVAAKKLTIGSRPNVKQWGIV